MQAGDRIERARFHGEAMGLLVLDHLEAMLDRAVEAICLRQILGQLRLQVTGGGQGGERVERRRRAQARIAAAVNHLLRLGEEFDLANPAAAALDVIARAERLDLGIMIAHPQADAANFVDHAEIERAAPNERFDRIQKALAERAVAAAGAGADEGGSLPRQSGRFIISDRRAHRQHDRSDLGRRAQPQVDARDITVGGALLEQFDQTAADPHRGLAGVVALTPRHRRGIVKQNQIDVGRIIELAAPKLARARSRRIPAGSASGTRSAMAAGKRPVDRVVGEIGQQGGDSFEVEFAGQVAERDRKSKAVTAAAKLGREVIAGGAKRARNRRLPHLRRRNLDQVRTASIASRRNGASLLARTIARCRASLSTVAAMAHPMPESPSS